MYVFQLLKVIFCYLINFALTIRISIKLHKRRKNLHFLFVHKFYTNKMIFKYIYFFEVKVDIFLEG